MSATGGLIYEVGGYTVHVLADGETLTPLVPSLDLDVLIVAGGGGGGAALGGGGGAGELLRQAMTITGPQTATVGAGGPGVTRNTGGNGVGTKGGDTTFNGVTAEGGGGGASYNTGSGGGTGGNGGGGGGNNPGGTGTQNNGGNAVGSPDWESGGGGAVGGPGQNGDDGGNQKGGDGGTGYDAADFGLGRIAGGGGGAGAYFASSTPGAGVDGGGNGAPKGAGNNGEDATGYGGGGGGADYPVSGTTTGGAGFDGVVAVRYVADEPEPPGPEPIPPPPPNPPTPVKVPELLWIYNLLGERILPLHELFDLELDRRLGEVDTLTAVIAADDPKADFVIGDTICEHRGRFYRIEEVTEARVGNVVTLLIYAEALWQDLANFTRPGIYSVVAQTPADGLALILNADTGWSVGTVPAIETLYSIEGIDDTVLTLVRDWAAVVGLEVVFDTAALTVSLVDRAGTERGIGFRYGRNLTAIDRRFEAPRATRMYAFGANDLGIEAFNPTGEPFVEDFSWYIAQGLTEEQARALYRKDEVWNDQRFLLGLNLFDAAVERIARRAQPIISYGMSVLDFSALTGVPEVEIGDDVRVYDAPLGLDIPTRVVRTVRRPLEPERSVVELDYLRPGLDTTSASRRSIDYGRLNVLVDSPLTPVTVSTTPLVFASLALTITGRTTVVTGATFVGTANGSGTVTFSMFFGGVQTGPTYSFDFVDGEQVEFSWPSYVADVEEQSTTLDFRAQVTSGAGTIDVPLDAARAWVLATGIYGGGADIGPDRDIVEAPTEPALDPATDVFAIDVKANIVIAPTETAPPASLPDPVVTITQPFTIGDPEFGTLGGPGVLSDPGVT